MLNELRDEFGFLANFVRALPPGRFVGTSTDAPASEAPLWGAIRSSEIAELGRFALAEGRDPG